MKKQKRIANWLKGLCIVIGIAMAIFFAVLFWVICFSGLLTYGHAAARTCFSAFICIAAYGILLQFWKVCVEIGRDNSFSLENADSFKKMGYLAIAMAVSYIIRIAFGMYLALAAGSSIPAIMNLVIFSLAMIFLCCVFTIVCFALSALIKNAYEVKLENELTI